MLYDLHMHSCLSPCAEDDMTPANIAGLAKLAGAELIAVTDHNAADNLPAVQCCCNAYGLRLLPGVEGNSCFVLLQNRGYSAGIRPLAVCRAAGVPV